MNNELSLVERKIEDLFGEEPLDQVDDELFKWLIFAYFDRGSGIKDLDRLQFDRFRNKLVQLVNAVYWRYQEKGIR